MSRYRYVGVICFFYSVIYILLLGKIIFTPDFGSSDAFHLNFAGKYYLAQTLQHNQLPYWTWLFSGGYPLLAEGQIGSLHLINIVLLKFLPFSLAYNFLYIVPLLFFTLGFYGVFREYKLSSLLSLLLTLNVSLCGGLMFQLTHLNYIQTTAYFPLILLCVLKFVHSNDLRYLTFIPFLISQMFFAGHPQGAFVVLLTVGLYGLGQISLMNRIGKKEKTYLLVVLFLSFLVGGLLALPQLLPSLQLAESSVRSATLDYSTVTQFPFTVKNFANFFTPFIFGNPKYGTYPLFSERWGIFWENTPYVGELFILFTIILIFLSTFKKNKILLEKNILYLIFLLFLFILLGLGKNSPLYFVYNFPPFAFFRVPSRFMIAVVFMLYITVAILLRKLVDRSSLIRNGSVVFLILNFLVLFYVTATYHLFVNLQELLKSPITATVVDHQGYKTLLAEQAWNKFFLKKGWKTPAEEKNYLFLKEALYPNLNLVYNALTLPPNTAGLQLRRSTLFESLLFEDINTKDNAIESLPTRVTNAYSYLGVKYFITPWPITDERFKPFKKISDNQTTLYLYKNPTTLQSAFFSTPQSISNIEYVTEFVDAYKKGTDFDKSAFIEEITATQNNNIDVSIKNVHRDSMHIAANITARNKTFVVAKLSYYPEWKLFINNKEEKLYKANIMYTGFFVPSGSSSVRLIYTNSSFHAGVLIASTTAFFYAFFLLALRKLELAKRLGLLFSESV